VSAIIEYRIWADERTVFVAFLARGCDERVDYGAGSKYVHASYT